MASPQRDLEHTQPDAVPAATVLIVDREDRVFTFRRRSSLPFAAGMTVFPGGRQDAQDIEVARAVPGMDPDRVTAVREAYEECGVLIAAGDLDAVALQRERAELAAGRPFAEVLARLGARLDPALLHPWARWITPPGHARMFDTVFFLAALPVGQQTGDLDSEGHHGMWLPPQEALARNHSGELTLLPPTLSAIEDLARAGSLQRAFGQQRRLDPVRSGPVITVDGRRVVRVQLPEQP